MDDDGKSRPKPLKVHRASEDGDDLPPPREWLVEGVILRRTVSLFSGRGGVGKSLLMLQLQTAMALGQPWLGRKVPNCRTFGFYAEDPRDEIRRRQYDIKKHYETRASELEDFEYACLDDFENPCLWRTTAKMQNGGPTPLWGQIVSQISDQQAELVIIDNAGAVFEANENYKEHVRPFVGVLMRLARDINGGVILLQHPSQTGEIAKTGESGSRMWRNTVRSQFVIDYPKEVTEDDPNDERILKIGKNNYGKREPPLRIEWKNGVFVPCALSDSQGGLSFVDKVELRAKILAEVRQGIERGEKFSAANGAPRHIASVLHKQSPWKRYTWNELAAAVAAMVADKKLVAVTIGSGTRATVLVRPEESRYAGEKADAEPPAKPPAEPPV